MLPREEAKQTEAKDGEMRAFVTGGTGFIGSNLTKRLVQTGHDVVVTGTITEQRIPDSVTLLTPGLVGIDWKRIGKMDVLFHLAANNDTESQDAEEMYHANVEASRELFERVVRSGCKQIVYASSTAVYGISPSPYVEEKTQLSSTTPYGKSKAMLERFAQDFQNRNPQVTLAGLRFCNVYGPAESHKGRRASMIYQLARQMQAGSRPRIFRSGEQKREWLYVEDAVEALLRAAGASGVVNCGTGHPWSFNEIVRTLNEVLGTSLEPEYFDNPHADSYQSHVQCDMSLAKEKIGFEARIDLRAGIAKYKNSGALTS